MMKNETYLKIRETHLAFARRRGKFSTYCPSEVARSLFPKNWREMMNTTRKVADDLCVENHLVVTQKSNEVSGLPSNIKGPIRLKLKSIPKQ